MSCVCVCMVVCGTVMSWVRMCKRETEIVSGGLFLGIAKDLCVDVCVCRAGSLCLGGCVCL